MRYFKTLVAAFCLMASVSSMALEVGDAAPSFSANHVMVDSSEVVKPILQTERSGQFLILDFFSTTCQYCIASMSTFASMASSLRDVVTTRYMFTDADQNNVRSFIQRNRAAITVEVGTDPTRQIPRAYGIRFVPTLLLINPSGVIVYKHVGLLTATEVNEITQIVRGLP